MCRFSRILVAAAPLAALVVPPLAMAVTIRADRADSQYLSLATNPAYASVGYVSGTTATYGFSASGTLIAPGWVLTAAHVVEDATSLTFSLGTSRYNALSWVPYPLWTGDLWTGYDIGLIHLSSPVPSVTPARRYIGSAEQGQQATVVGFGMTGTGKTGAIKFDAKKRAELNVIDKIDGSNILYADFDNPQKRRDSSLGSFTPLNLEGMVAPGDSGGGLFITTTGGTFLAGVTSFLQAWDGRLNSDYGDISGETRVSPFNSWIDWVISGAAGAPPPPVSSARHTFAAASTFAPTSRLAMVQLTTSVPEPGSLSLWAAGVLALGFWWRLRRRS